MFGTTASPLRSAEHSILFSEKSVRCPTAHEVRLVRTRRKKDAERGKSAKQTCTSGSPFFCLLFFGEAKKSKCPVGTRRMVKAAPKANHKAPAYFQAAFAPHAIIIQNHQKQPENQPNGVSAARRHLASWQISYALFEAIGDAPSPLQLVSGCIKSLPKKGSLKIENRLVVSQTVFLLGGLAFRLPISLQKYSP